MKSKYNKQLLVGKFLSFMDSTEIPSINKKLNVQTENIYKQDSDKFLNRELKSYVVEKQEGLPKSMKDTLQRLEYKGG